jgi:hypothetical protein
MRFLESLGALGAVAMLLVAGCGQEVYRAEMELLADGQISRANYRPPADSAWRGHASSRESSMRSRPLCPWGDAALSRVIFCLM